MWLWSKSNIFIKKIFFSKSYQILCKSLICGWILRKLERHRSIQYLHKAGAGRVIFWVFYNIPESTELFFCLSLDQIIQAWPAMPPAFYWTLRNQWFEGSMPMAPLVSLDSLYLIISHMTSIGAAVWITKKLMVSLVPLEPSYPVLWR